MNLYFRLLIMLIKTRFKKPYSLFSEYRTKHRVYPNDLDLLGHVNNGRYFTITDLVRMEMLIHAGVWKALRKRGLYAVMAGETIQFRKPLMPFQRYNIVSKMLGWDESFFYVEHKFESEKGLHALLIVKVRMLGGKGHRVSPKEVFGFVGYNQIQDRNINHLILSWNESTNIHWMEENPAVAKDLKN